MALVGIEVLLECVMQCVAQANSDVDLWCSMMWTCGGVVVVPFPSKGWE